MKKQKKKGSKVPDKKPKKLKSLVNKAPKKVTHMTKNMISLKTNTR